MQNIEGKMRSAIIKYNMINAGDHIAVGLSGGKDSTILLTALANLKRYIDIPFELTAITIDPQFNNTPSDFSPLEQLCEKLGVHYIIYRSTLYDIVFNQRKESNPCSMCARMRRGILCRICKENGINKLALGHHFDDAVQTFMMNLFDGGNINCFAPISHMSRQDIWVIRPMIFVDEQEIKRVVRRVELPVVKSGCPIDGGTERQAIADTIAMLEKQYPDLKNKIMGAMQRSHLNGF